MCENAEATRRARGRPQLRPDEETRGLLIEAASQEFQASGYAGASMATVAQRAGVSTKTLYRLIPTKADLFQSVVSDRIAGFMLEVDEDAPAGLTVEAALERILLAYGILTLDGQTIAMSKLVLAECDRFPEIGAAFHELAVRRTRDAMEAWLRRQCERGLIALEDPRSATGMLRGMMIMEPQRAVMLGRCAPPDAAEIGQRARACARIFLDGCRRTAV
ncbi:MAG TPA: TetR/AcrR family transcriptional regulator [Roseomonas sp.]|jgi:AcrR family transcriptional regulator